MNEVTFIKLEILFLKIVVCITGVLSFVICIFVLPMIANELGHYPSYLIYPFLISISIAIIIFIIALYQILKLLNYINRNNFFSELSIKAIKNIKICTIIISVLSMIAIPFVYYIAEKDDAPGILAITLIIISASVVASVFASFFQKILKNAKGIK